MATIELHTWGTPNGRKVSIMLEECGLPYSVHKVDISKGEQHKPEFLRISPNNRIPAIVDPNGPGGKPISLFESGAILIYLAEKTGKFLPTDPAAKYKALEWLMWQMGGVGPMFGHGTQALASSAGSPSSLMPPDQLSSADTGQDVASAETYDRGSDYDNASYDDSGFDSSSEDI